MIPRIAGVFGALALAVVVAIAAGQAGGQAGGQTGGQTGSQSAGQSGQPGGRQEGQGAQGAPGSKAGVVGSQNRQGEGAKGAQQKQDSKNGELEEDDPLANLAFFGDDYFAQARAIIAAQRDRLARAGTPPESSALIDPTGFQTGFQAGFQSGLQAGGGQQATRAPGAAHGTPLPNGVRVPAPQRYVLGRGDRLRLRYWSSIRPAQEIDLLVDDEGAITLPETTKPLSVIGQTVASAEALIRRDFGQIIRGVQFSLTLAELRTISVSVLGESFSPGTFDVPASTTLFNIVYATGGPTSRGTLRRISLRRAGGGTQFVDFYRLLAQGETTGDQVLRDGDIVYIAPASILVKVIGEVNRPGIYEALPGEHVSRILSFAGGVKATGVGQRVLVQTVDKGIQRRVVDVDLTLGDKGPELFSGDIIEVRPVREGLSNAVDIEGAVDVPGRYALTEGMKVGDLIRKSRGVLPKAFPRALLYRMKDDGTRELIRIDLAKAEAGDPSADIPLRRDDRLVVSAMQDINWLGGRFVVVNGAVRLPDTYERADGMRLSDVLVKAGGPTGDTFYDLAFLQRRQPDGSAGAILRINLRRAILGDPEHDVLLQDRDELRVFTFAEARFQATKSVTVDGAVVAPGTYERGEGMKVRDLLDLAGNAKPDAFMQTAFLQRMNPDGTPGRLEKVDLEKAAQNDPAHNLALGDGDRLQVLTKDEANYSADRTVKVAGAVQRPGDYPASENLSLADLIRLAGGPLPNAGALVEITSRYQPVGTEPRRVQLGDVLSGSTEANLPLKPGDAVTLNIDSSIVTKVQLVTLQGAVMNPGVYALTGDPSKDTLANLVRRAGGLSKRSFTKGTQILRNPELLTTEIQKAILPRTWSLFQELSQSEYQRAVARVNFERVRGLFGNLNNINIPPTSPNLTPPAQPDKKQQDPEAQSAGPDAGQAGAQGAAQQAGQKPNQPQAKGGTQGPGQTSPRSGAGAAGQATGQNQTAGQAGNGTRAPGGQPAGSQKAGTKSQAGEDEETADQSTLKADGPVAPVPVAPTPRTVDEAIAFSLGSQAVTQARALSDRELIPLGNIAFNAEQALRRPGGPADILLKDGDVITIPEPPTTVSLTGAVVLPATVPYSSGSSLAWYLQRAGGLAADANRDAVLVIRASGEIIAAKRGTRITAGDVIFVPTAIQAIKISQFRETLRDVSQFSQSALTSVALIRSLVR